MLINGWEIRIYDAKASTGWKDTLLVCNQGNCDTSFIRLKEHLSSNNIIKTLRKRIINSIEDTFSIEIEEIRLDQFHHEIERSISNLKEVVSKNSREFQLALDQDIDNQTMIRLEKSPIEELIEEMNVPIFDRPFAANEYIKRIINSEENEKNNLIMKLIQKCNTNSHTIFKMWSVYIMAKLLNDDITIKPISEFGGIQKEFNDIIRKNFTYWEENETINAINHFDNITLRLSRRICHLQFENVNKYLSETKEIFSREDVIKSNLTLVSVMVQCYNSVSGLLWNDFANSSSPNEIWDGYWLCQYLEKILSNFTYNNFSFQERDLLFFELYGSSFDLLFTATRRILNKFSNLHVFLDDHSKSLLRLSENEFIKGIPRPRSKPIQWDLPLEKYKDRKVVELIKILHSKDELN